MEILAFLLNLVIFLQQKNGQEFSDGCLLQLPHFKGSQPNPNTRNALGVKGLKIEQRN